MPLQWKKTWSRVFTDSPQWTQSVNFTSPAEQSLLPTHRARHNTSQVIDASSFASLDWARLSDHLGWTAYISRDLRPYGTTAGHRRGLSSPVWETCEQSDIHDRKNIRLRVNGGPFPRTNKYFFFRPEFAIALRLWTHSIQENNAKHMLTNLKAGHT